jgi:hypothetical protein
VDAQDQPTATATIVSFISQPGSDIGKDPVGQKW